MGLLRWGCWDGVSVCVCTCEGAGEENGEGLLRGKDHDSSANSIVHFPRHSSSLHYVSLAMHFHNLLKGITITLHHQAYSKHETRKKRPHSSSQ